MNRIHALLITEPDGIREGYPTLAATALVTALYRSRPKVGTGPEDAGRQALKRLARRHRGLSEEIAVIEQEMELLIRSVNPVPLGLSGVGPITATTLLVAAGAHL